MLVFIMDSIWMSFLKESTKLHKVVLLGQWGWSPEKGYMLNVLVYVSETYM